MKKIKYILLLTIGSAIGLFYLGFLGSTSEIVEAQTKPEARFALLIGINEYDDNGISDLRGTENDVKLMRDLLMKKYNFKDSDIKEMISSKTSKTEKPNKKNIEAAFRKSLIEKAMAFKKDNPNSEGATILFYYSGHGSYVPDQEGEGKDEYFDGYDETIVPSDAVKTSETSDIRDDDLDKWFKELKKYTSNITFVFDSCHSGTITRGANNKSIKGREFAKKTQSKGNKTLNETMDDEDGYVTISGSLPNEQSQEGEVAILPAFGEKAPADDKPKEQWNGYLTYYLVKELSENSGMSVGELMRTVSTALTKKNKEQTPQVEGDTGRQFLGTKETRGKRSIPIKKIEKIGNDTILTIEAGKLVGALEGGLVGIYKETAVQLAGETDKIAVGKIIESLNFSSRVIVIGAEIPPKSKIVLATPFFTDKKRKVAIDTSGTDANARILKDLKDLLTKNDFFEAVETKIEFRGYANWNVAVVQGSYAQFSEGYPKSTKDGTIKNNDKVFYLATPNGNPIYNFWVKMDDAGAKIKIQEALEKYTRVENFLTLDNAVSNMSGEIELKLIRFKSLKPNAEGCESEEYTAAELKEFEEKQIPISPGDWYYFEIINNTDQALYPYLYNVSTDGAIKLFYEPKADSEKLASGKSLPLFNPKNCSGKVAFQAEEPFGKETFKVIATSARFYGKMLESAAIAVNRRNAGLSTLESLFDQASTNKRSEATSIPFSGWTTSTKEFDIVPKKDSLQK